MKYPLSDHYDGEHFFNPEPSLRAAPPDGKKLTLGSFVLARLKKDPANWATWPKHIENRHYPLPPAPVADMQATFIGHSSFLLRLPGLTVLTDPVFSKRCSPTQLAGPRRVRAPGISLKNLPDVDLILLSHNHYDHLDVAALKALRKRFPAVKMITSLGNADFLAKKGMRGAVELDWWQAHHFGETVVTATPARHFAARTLWDRNETLWCGFMLQHGGSKLYFAGDSGYTKYFRDIHSRLGAPDLALLPIGAYAPRWFMQAAHMNPADAVQALIDLRAVQAVGMHFGTFQLTAEPIDEPEAGLKAALAAAGLPPERFITLDCGETGIFAPATADKTGAIADPEARVHL
jgi:L-ascorbate metabolism protein UlaG (beta-lactamase superfamily)